MDRHERCRVSLAALALILLAAGTEPAWAAPVALSCGDPEPVASARPGPRTGPTRERVEVEIDAAAGTMRVDGRLAPLRGMPEGLVSTGPLTRAGGIAHHEYVVVERDNRAVRVGQMSPEGMTWGLMRYRCAPREDEAAGR